MKLIMSPEKEEGESFPFPPHSSKGVKKEKDRDKMQHSKSSKKKLQQSRDPLPVVGKEVEVEGKIIYFFRATSSSISYKLDLYHMDLSNPFHLPVMFCVVSGRGTC